MDKHNLVILHGWQSKVDRWKPLKAELSKDFKVFAPDLPGFGSNKIHHKNGWNLNDYCGWLKNYLKKNKINQPVLVGHSFGGRIAIKYASFNPGLRKLVLIASAGLNNKSIKKTVGFYAAKTGNLLFSLPGLQKTKKFMQWFLYKLLREQDYYEANEFQKKTMSNVIREDEQPYLKKIKSATLIIWGENDRLTPFWQALVLAKEIKNNRLRSFPNSGHDVPFSKFKEVAREITEFIKK